MSQKIINLCFSLLFTVTPFIFTPLNYELFEYNKMIFVYLLTVIIAAAWIFKMISQRSLIFNRTPFDIPLLLFFGAQVLSTIFSIDSHTSIFGYYSRSNGGLLSITCYLALYWAAVTNLDKEAVIKILKSSVVAGGLISIWAILEHFGLSPSCVILRGEFNASCWVQDVAARVFATLGQPNWLAAYLGMLIFPAWYFLITTKHPAYFLLTIIYYLAFTFTYSRGGTLGLAAGLVVFLVPLVLRFHHGLKLNFANLPKSVIVILIIFLVINLIYGSALTRFKLSELLPQDVSHLNQEPQRLIPSITQLEAGGTESGKIRLIVWQGAWEIFKHYPLFGSGVETFAYSYYQFRPQEHNLVSEWDFLYNKAHNEYLNYLATTGIVGFLSYILIILTFIIWSFKILNLKFPIFNENLKLKIENSKTHSQERLLIISIAASYVSYLIQNIFGFSVVVTNLFFFLFPALAFIYQSDLKTLKRSLNFSKFWIVFLKFILGFTTVILILAILKLWYADVIFARGNNASVESNPTQAYNDLTLASNLNSLEPFYKSELGFAAASVAVTLSQVDSTLSATLKDEAISQTATALKISPKNVSFYRTAIRTYYQLSSIEESFIQKTLDTLDLAIKLAPTDPKLYYHKAIILDSTGKTAQALENLNQALQLKPNYREAYIALGLLKFEQKDYPEAVANMNKVLQIIPTDPEALQYLNDWGKQGIATGSGTQ